MNNGCKMNDKTEHAFFENVNGNRIILSYTKIGKFNNGCKFTLKFSNQKRNAILLGAVPLFLAVVLQFLISISTTFNIIAILVFLLVFLCKLCNVKSESLTLIPHIGLQYSIEHNRGFDKDTFIQWEHIDSFIINEVVIRQRIIYLVTVIIKNQSNETSLLPLFQTTKPRLECLEGMYNILQNIIETYKGSPKSL